MRVYNYKLSYSMPKKCNRISCGKQIMDLSKPKQRKFCSFYCRKQDYREKSRIKSPFSGICSGSVGAISELAASVDLMKKGFEVYRALSPASSCDILALKDGKIYDFEVRTGYRNLLSNTFTVNNANVRAKYFILVVYNKDKIPECHFTPEII